MYILGTDGYRTFLRDQLQRKQPPIYVPMRLLSTQVSWRLARVGVSPHLLTGLGLLAALAASAVLAIGQPQELFVGGLLILVAYLFDCMDGEVARIRGLSSVLGSRLDQFSNWFTLIALQIGLSFGANALTENPQMLVWGMFAVAGWCTFYYLYLQIASWVPANHSYWFLRKLSWVLFAVMPLDENLVVLFALFGRPDLGIEASAVIGVSLSVLVCITFISSSVHRGS